MTLFLPNPDTLAVVPLVFNAGAAVLPALLGALASVVTLLFKPKELFAACKRRPLVPLAIVLVGTAIFFWVRHTPAAAAPGRLVRETASSGSGHDWAAVAMEIIRQEARAKALGGAKVEAVEETGVASKEGAAIQFRGDAGRAGYLGGSSPVGLVPLWEYSEDGAMFFSSVLVHGGKVYGASAFLDPSGSFGTIFCLDAETGEEIWVTDTGGPNSDEDLMGFFSSPSITADGKNLLIGQGLHPDFGASLLCLDTATGRINWAVKTPLHVESSPAIEGDIVVVGAGAVERGADRKPQGDPKGEGHPGYVFGVRISDGKELWQHQVNDPESSPVIRDGIAYIGSGINGSAVVAIRIAPDEELGGKPRELWRTATPFPASGPTTIAGDLILIGCGAGDFVFTSENPEGMVIAMDHATGEIRWEAKMPSTILGAIAVRDGIAICPVRNGEVIALDLNAEGKELWRARVHKSSPVMAGPAFTGSHVYAVSSNGYLAVIDGKNGKVLESVYINDPGKPGELGLSISSPLVAGGRLYVGSETGGVRCYVGK